MQCCYPQPASRHLRSQVRAEFEAFGCLDPTHVKCRSIRKFKKVHWPISALTPGSFPGTRLEENDVWHV